MASPEPLQPYRKVQSEAEKELGRILESTARSIRQRIGLLKVGIGGDVRRAQLTSTLAAIRRMQRSMWTDVGGVASAGMDDAEKAAESAIETMTRVAYASLPDAAAETLVRGLRAAAESGLKSDRARKRRELSGRVYRQAALNEGKVEQMIREGLIANLSAKELAATVYDHVSPTAKGGASYAAMRLARTEINNAFHERQLEGAKRPGVRAAKWNLSGSHKVPDKCNVYAAHNGTGEWGVNSIPEKPHPQCFCYLTYVTTPPEEFRKRLAAGSFDDEIERRVRERMAQQGQKVGKIKPDPSITTPDQFDDRVSNAATGGDALVSATYGLERKSGSTNYNRMQREMRRGVNQYTGRWFTEINTLLRGGKLEHESDRATVEEYIEGIDAAMADSTIDKEVLVYRGMRNARVLFEDRLDNDMTGLEWEEKSYVSTTSVQARTRTFLSGSDPGKVLLRIVVPRGTSAVEASPVDAEAELLLNRGQKLRVVRDNGMNDEGIRMLDVEVIGA